MRAGDYVKVQVYDDAELVYAIGRLKYYDRTNKIWGVDHGDGTESMQSRNEIEVLTKEQVVLFKLECQ